MPTLGIAHPSGYPLYTLLGKLFTLLLPFRDPAGRVNLLSALCAGPTVGILICWRGRLAGNRAAAATAARAIFALCRAGGRRRPRRSLRPPRAVLVCSSTCCCVGKRREGRGRRQGQGAGARGQETTSDGPFPTSNVQPPTASNDRYLAAAAFVCGLGLAHHRMIALLLPAALILSSGRIPVC